MNMFKLAREAAEDAKEGGLWATHAYALAFLAFVEVLHRAIDVYIAQYNIGQRFEGEDDEDDDEKGREE